jgi:hypothetical protein
MRRFRVTRARDAAGSEVWGRPRRLWGAPPEAARDVRASAGGAPPAWRARMSRLALASIVLCSGCWLDPGAECELDGDCLPEERCEGGACVPRECDIADDCASGACFDGRCAACGSDADCGAGDAQVCASGDCVERQCTVNSDCADGRACASGICLPCTYDGQCGPDEACHHGGCVLRECYMSDGCTAGLVCDQGRCLPCGPTVQCEGGLACVGATCVPCTSDADCGADRLCRSERCHSICASDAECGNTLVMGCRSRDEPLPCGEIFCAGEATSFPQHAVCDPCQRNSGGCATGECDADLRCTCGTNADCPSNLVCNGGVCTGCNDDDQCGCDRYCQASECRDRCTSDADCGGGRCLVSTGRCVPCTSDADCGGETCYEDGCVGMCGDLLSCAPFVPCEDNGRCGFCGECRVGPNTDPIGRCP